MKIAVLSNATWCPTGYGVQSKHLHRVLRSLGHETIHVANFGLDTNSRPIEDADGVVNYPRMYHVYGEDAIVAAATRTGADIALILFDIWPFNVPAITRAGVRVVPWAPVDHEPVPPAVAAMMHASWHPTTYSHFGVEELRKTGLEVDYAPHVVDPEKFYPDDKVSARKELGIDTDCYLVGIVAGNKGFPPRKAWIENCQALARFFDRHDDARAYFHTTPGRQRDGVDLIALLRSLGIDRKVYLPDQVAMDFGLIDDDYMRAVYSAMDVHLAVTQGEGCHVPLLEASFCGVPSIYGEWTASEEHGNGLGVRRALGEPVWTLHQSWQFYTPPAVIAHALDDAYGHGILLDPDHNEKFTIDAAKPHWKKIIDKIDASLAFAADHEPVVSEQEL